MEKKMKLPLPLEILVNSDVQITFGWQNRSVDELRIIEPLYSDSYVIIPVGEGPNMELKHQKGGFKVKPKYALKTVEFQAGNSRGYDGYAKMEFTSGWRKPVYEIRLYFNEREWNGEHVEHLVPLPIFIKRWNEVHGVKE
ncbi:hypothetical protein ACFL0V_05520 [Nanoarchaeota archaeon]